VLTELADLVMLEKVKGFAGGLIGPHQIGGIEDVAQLIAIEATEVDV
jgi:hypothetical protein